MLCLQLLFYVVGFLMNIIAIRNLGAPLVSAIIAWSFVVALLFGTSPLLNEPINEFNIAGACIVSASVTLYLGYQYYISRRLGFSGRDRLSSEETPKDGLIQEEPLLSPFETPFSPAGDNDDASDVDDDVVDGTSDIDSPVSTTPGATSSEDDDVIQRSWKGSDDLSERIALSSTVSQQL